MGRPSLKQQRITEILDAYGRCITRYGLEGATMDRVAEEAQMARPLIRHNVGNRDQLFAAFVARYFDQAKAELAQLETALSNLRSGPEVIAFLFDDQYDDADSVLIFEELIAAGKTDPDLARHLRTWLDGFVTGIEGALRACYPTAPQASVHTVAHGVMGILFNVGSFAMLGDMEDFRTTARSAALTLIETLNQQVA